MKPENYILKTIKQLRQHEEVLIFDHILKATEFEEQEIIAFLKEEYTYELPSYTTEAPDFNAEAAIWSAYLVYLSCQFLLHRSQAPEEFHQVFPPPFFPVNAGAILSADLLLRFLPAILLELKRIDEEDELIPFLEDMLKPWSYSSIGYAMLIDEKSTNSMLQDPCVKQLYLERIIKRKDEIRASHTNVKDQIKSKLGLHKEVFWKEINF